MASLPAVWSLLLVGALITTALDADWFTTAWLLAGAVTCAAAFVVVVGSAHAQGCSRWTWALGSVPASFLGPVAFLLVFSQRVRRDLATAVGLRSMTAAPSAPIDQPLSVVPRERAAAPVPVDQPASLSAQATRAGERPPATLVAIAGRLVLTGLLFPLLFFGWVVLAGISGDESFTDGVIRGGVVGTALLAGAAVVIVAARWSSRVRVLPQAERSRRLMPGGLTALGVLGLIGVGAGVLLHVVGHGPLNLSPPTITGTPRFGETLTASPGRWNPRRKGKLDFEYFWFRCRGEDCDEFDSDSPRYRLDRDDIGTRISVSVLAIGNLNAMADSAPTTVIQPLPAPHGVIAFTHSLHDTSVYAVDEKGRQVRRLLQEASPVSQAVESPDGKQIAFVSNRDGSGEIYVMKSNRTQRRQLTRTDGFNIDPAWSPDARQIAFSSARDGNPEIYVMNADGSRQRRLTRSPDRDENPVWSPDGKKIAFWSNRDGNHELYVMRSDGSNETRLTRSKGDDEFPAWSPDGSTLAFTSERDGNAELYLLRLRDRNLTRLTRNPAWDGAPSWSPDGKRLAFVSDRGGDDDIWVMNAVGEEAVNYSDKNDYGTDDFGPAWSHVRRITFTSRRNSFVDVRWVRSSGGEVTIALDDADSPAWSRDGKEIATASSDGDIYVNAANLSHTRRLRGRGFDWSPDWSPDSRRVVFVSDRSGEDHIYVMGSDGRNPKRLTVQGTNEDPAWSPDGRRIAFDSDRSGHTQLFVMRPDGREQAPLAFSAEAAEPAWSPDGREIAFSSDLRGRWEIYVAAVGGRRARRIADAPIGYDDSAPTWSPDGLRIAFDREGDDGSDVVYVLAVRGGQARVVVRTPEPTYDPSWQPSPGQ